MILKDYWAKSWFRAACVVAFAALLVLGLAYSPLRVRYTVRTELVGPSEPIILLRDEAPLEDIQAAVLRSGKKADQIATRGSTMLDLAVEEEREDVAKWLLQQGANPNGMPRGYPPLATAVSKGNLSLVTLLVEAGADPDLDMGDGMTPRSIAVNHGNITIIAALPPKRP
jgi:ankyrin repeat protein